MNIDIFFTFDNNQQMSDPDFDPSWKEHSMLFQSFNLRDEAETV